ncbi:MAG TPA: NAD(P)-binding protein [Vicinamibacteria bacterium]|nr:NAD(P)-binding protein [Vicinamibacteria bacterium]
MDTGERYDLIVVGGGLSGLGAAWFFQKQRGGRCLVLDNHPLPGGEAKRNEFMVDGIHLIGPQGSNDFGTRPPPGWGGEYWREIGLPAGAEAFEHQSWPEGVKPLEMPREHYYFQLWADEFTSHGFYFAEPDGSLRMVRDAFRSGIQEMPWSEKLRSDFLRWRTDPKVHEGDLPRWLDTMTYEELLVRELKLDPAVARYADPILAGAAGGLGSDVISAQCAAQIGMPGTGNGENKTVPLEEILSVVTAFPGGNDGIMCHVLKKLSPNAIEGEGFAGVLGGRIRFEELDREGSFTRLRMASTAIRILNLPDGTVEVIYARGGKLSRATAAGVVMANGAWSSQYIVADLGPEYREAFQDFVRAPMLVVNVALHRWRALHNLGITAASCRDRIGFCCNLRQSLVVGDYRPPLHPDKPTVLTFYVPFERPGSGIREQASSARYELLAATYREYEMLIREQLMRLFARGGFDARRDVAGIISIAGATPTCVPLPASTSAAMASRPRPTCSAAPRDGSPSPTPSSTATRTGSTPPRKGSGRWSSSSVDGAGIRRPACACDRPEVEDRDPLGTVDVPAIRRLASDFELEDL